MINKEFIPSSRTHLSICLYMYLSFLGYRDGNLEAE
jgi:hypothetical protein